MRDSHAGYDIYMNIKSFLCIASSLESDARVTVARPTGLTRVISIYRGQYQHGLTRRWLAPARVQAWLL